MAAIQTDPQYKLRLSPDLKARIETAAKNNNRSMNAEIISRLEQSFEVEVVPVDKGDARIVTTGNFLREILEVMQDKYDALVERIEEKTRLHEEEIERLRSLMDSPTTPSSPTPKRPSRAR